MPKRGYGALTCIDSSREIPYGCTGASSNMFVTSMTVWKLPPEFKAHATEVSCEIVFHLDHVSKELLT